MSAPSDSGPVLLGRRDLKVRFFLLKIPFVKSHFFTFSSRPPVVFQLLWNQSRAPGHGNNGGGLCSRHSLLLPDQGRRPSEAWSVCLSQDVFVVAVKERLCLTLQWLLSAFKHLQGFSVSCNWGVCLFVCLFQPQMISIDISHYSVVRFHVHQLQQ